MLYSCAAVAQTVCRDTTVKVAHTIYTDSTYQICQTVTIDSVWKGCYVSGLKSIAGVKSSEDKLIAALNKGGFTACHFYGIDGANSVAVDPLFKRIRKETKVKEIGATASSGSTFAGARSSWNATHADSADYNAFNLEFEPWRAVANNSTVAVEWGKNVTYLQQMSKLYTTSMKYVTDYYGWWTDAPMTTQTPDTLVKYLSYSLIHDYRAAPEWSYMQTRCNDLNAAAKRQGKVVTVRAIFSAEPAFMQTWLKTHSLDEAYSIILTAFKAEKYSNLKMDGYMVFTIDFWLASQPASAKARQADQKIDPNFQNVTVHKNVDPQ